MVGSRSVRGRLRGWEFAWIVLFFVAMVGAGAQTQAVTGMVTVSPEPAAFEVGYGVTAVFDVPTGSPIPTGTVTFSADDGNGVILALGSAALVNGMATLAVPADPQSSLGPPLLPGMRVVMAVYGGDANYAGVTVTGSHVVDLAPSSVALMPTTPMQVYYGEPIDGIVEISVLDPNYQAIGTYSVLSNGVLVPGCINLANNASCPYGNPQLLDAGTYVLTIAYNGGPANGDPVNDSSLSGPYQYVVSPDLTTATLSTSLTPANFGTPVTFTATVTGNIAVPNGAVQFFDGGSLLGSGTLNAAGVATFTTSSLAVGTHTITANYPGAIDFNPAATNAVTQKIVAVANPLASQVFLASSLNPAPQGLNVTFTATAAVAGPFGQIATGNVSFLDGTSVIGSGVLNGLGVATFSTSTLAVGSHAITAAYGGDSASAVSTGTLPSVSAVLTELITTPLIAEPAGFTLTITPNPVTVGIGRTAALLVTVTPVSGFSQAVNLSCSGMPYESACLFVAGTIPAGGGSTTLQVSTMAPHDCGDPGHPYVLGELGTGLGVTIAGLLLMPRRRRWMRVVLLGCALGGLSALAGCGHCTDLGTRPGSYSFVVSGVAQGGPVAQTASVTVKMVVGVP
jgi:hypothetical protein